MAGLALSACGGGDGRPNASSEVALPTVTAPNAATVGGNRDARAASRPPTSGSRGSVGGLDTQKDTGSASSPEDCLQMHTRQECTEMAAAQGSGPSPLVRSQDCLKTHSRRQCEEMAAAQGSGPSPLVRPQDCLKTHTRQQCEAMVPAQR